MQKYVYLFSEGNATMRNLLGGKGANLAEMTALGMPVPQGFTVTTEACTRYYEDGRTIGADIQQQIDEALRKLQKQLPDLPKICARTCFTKSRTLTPASTSRTEPSFNVIFNIYFPPKI